VHAMQVIFFSLNFPSKLLAVDKAASSFSKNLKITEQDVLTETLMDLVVCEFS